MSALRRGYLMQFWMALYAAYSVWPAPRLTAFTVGLLALLAALLYDTRPSTQGVPR